MDNTKEILKIAYEALAEKKADDIKVIDISKISTIADYFIITNGDNPLQVQALADNVTEKLAKAGVKPRSVEGMQSANWVLMDYNDIIINVFSKDDRKFYNLERIWGDGIFIEKI